MGILGVQTIARVGLRVVVLWFRFQSFRFRVQGVGLYISYHA